MAMKIKAQLQHSNGKVETFLVDVDAIANASYIVRDGIMFAYGGHVFKSPGPDVVRFNQMGGALHLTGVEPLEDAS